MSDNQEVKIGKLVCDAVPDPPRVPNTFDDDESVQTQSQNQTTGSEKISSEDDSTKSTNTDNVKPKKKSKVLTKPSKTTNTWNFMNCSGLTIGNTTNYVYNNNRDSSNTPSTQENGEKPATIPAYTQTLLNIDSKLSKEDIEIIRTELGNGWKKFSKEIGYSRGQIDQFLMNYEARGMSEVIYKILKDWTQNNTTNATLGKAVKALWTSKEFECIEKLAKAHNLL